MKLIFFMTLAAITLTVDARTYSIFNNTANVLTLNIDREHFGQRTIMLNAYDKQSISDIEDVFIKDGKSLPACSKQLILIDAKSKKQLAAVSFNDKCKNADILIINDAKNNYKLEAKNK